MFNKVKKSLLFLLIVVAFFGIYILFSSSNNNYYLFIYNSNEVTEDDVEYINNYAKTLDGQVKIIDSKGVVDGYNMYSALQKSYKGISNNIKGIQIFGTKNQVPAFNVGYEIDMGDKIDTAYDDFLSDFFYSNFESVSSCLSGRIGINSVVTNGADVLFKPRWIVSRLPLTKGQIAPFIKKYFDYKDQIKDMKNIPIVSFSNPILLQVPVIDDMGYFISKKIDSECRYLNKSQYRLYGLLSGVNKINSNVEGDFTKENISQENKRGIMQLFINCHGEKDKFIKTVFSGYSLGEQKMTSFMDRGNINEVLNNNYYTLTAWACLVASGLDDQNIVYDMLRNKCIDAMASTTIISNNGTDNRDSFEESRKNNFYCFYYELFRSLAGGCSRSQSFSNAQKVYAESVLAHRYMEYSQYHILNLLGYHYFGLIY